MESLPRGPVRNKDGSYSVLGDRPAVVVTVPDFEAFGARRGASPEEDEDIQEALACLRLGMCRPWRDPAKDLRKGHASWRAAAADMTPKERSSEGRTNAAAKADFKRRTESEGGPPAVVVIDTFEVLQKADPALHRRCFPTGIYCEHCGAAKAKEDGGEIQLCACRRAAYCSKACQKAAYWHHKRAVGMDGAHAGCTAKVSKTK